MLALPDKDIMKSEITVFKRISSDNSAEDCLGLTAL